MTDRPARASTAVEEALVTRRSTRAFSARAVPRHEVEHLLAVASRAPSNSNTQPWHVHVLTGIAKERVATAIWELLDEGRRCEAEDRYQPGSDAWPEPLATRRRTFGTALYGDALGIAPDDVPARAAHHRRNYEFFGAPVGLILTVDRGAAAGGLVDTGAFLQSLALIAHARGLATCPQAAFNDFHPVLRRELGLERWEQIVCGVALGHPDRDHSLDRLVTERATVEEFTTFHG